MGKIILTKPLLNKLFIEEKKHPSEIANFLNVNEKTVKRKIKEYGLYPDFSQYDRMVPKDQQKLKDLYAKGKTSKEISQILNLNVSTINKKLINYGLKDKRIVMPKKIWTIEEIKILQEFRVQRIGAKEVSRQMGIHYRYVETKMRLLELEDRIEKDWKIISAKFINLFNQDLSYDDIAQWLKLNHTALCAVAVRKGFISSGKQEQLNRSELKGNNKKKCSKCGNIKHIHNDFHSMGHSWCKECNNKNSSENNRYLKGNKELKRIITKRFGDSKLRASSKGFRFNLTKEFLENLYTEQCGKCFYSGLELSLCTSDNFSLSIDRVNSNLGYETGNVVLCCKIINYMKLDLSEVEFKNIIKRLYDNYANL